MSAAITAPTQLTGTYSIDPGHTSIGFVGLRDGDQGPRQLHRLRGQLSIDAEKPFEARCRAAGGANSMIPVTQSG
jgi:polyisoprenoid-binding protein YceI